MAQVPLENCGLVILCIQRVLDDYKYRRTWTYTDYL